MIRARLLGFLLTMCVASSASAEAERTVASSRIHLRDVSTGYEEAELGELDLGPAPPPGSSRLLPRAEVEQQLRAAGDDTSRLKMPATLRVRSASKRWSAEEFQQALRPVLLLALPPGVSLQATKFMRPLLTSPSVSIGSVHIPKLPKRVGELTVTVGVDMMQEGVTTSRVPVTVVVLISEAATRPALSKGARVNLTIERGAARVSALAIALSDGELGSIGLFRVSTTQRVLRARVQSSDSAQVIE